MTDLPQTPESVAYALLQDVAKAEDVALGVNRASGKPTDRKWILDTFAECLRCVKAEAVKTAPTHGRSSF